MSSASSTPSRISSSRSHRAASSMTWLLTSSVVPPAASRRNSVPEVAAQHGVEAHGGLVEHQHLGRRPAARRQARPGPPGRRTAGCTTASAWVGQPDLADDPVDVAARRAEDGGEVAQVLAHREVGVDRRRLGDVADRAAQLRRPGRPAEHLDRAALDDLHADDRAHQRCSCRSRWGQAGRSRCPSAPRRTARRAPFARRAPRAGHGRRRPTQPPPAGCPAELFITQ